jgi:hypothetical protein
LIERIKAFAAPPSGSLPYPPASEDAVEKAERALGFPIPPLLKRCYLEVGNGGFGPGYGIVGVEGGYISDHGHLAEIYATFRRGEESEGGEWQNGLLPFCEYGCNIYSCVDCIDPDHPVYAVEDGEASPQHYTLDRFFELWLSAVNVLSPGPRDTESIEITNPFTGRKSTISRRRRRNPGG